MAKFTQAEKIRIMEMAINVHYTEPSDKRKPIPDRYKELRDLINEDEEGLDRGPET